MSGRVNDWRPDRIILIFLSYIFLFSRIGWGGGNYVDIASENFY